MQAKKKIVSRPLHANVGIGMDYARRLERLVDTMHKSVKYWLLRAYSNNPPRAALIAMDASPSEKMEQIIKQLEKYWRKKFNESAKKMAKYFAQEAYKRNNRNLRDILMESGFAINFALSPAQRDILRATVNENVALITNLSDQHMQQIRGLVMRSVQQGGDVGGLAKQLEQRYHMTRRRARLIALDQNSKANAALSRARELELGIEQAVWLHSHAGKTPRPTHVAMHGKTYDVHKGMWDDHARWQRGVGWVGDYVHPGELINCRCAHKVILNLKMEPHK